jgi:hypothetical protein
LFRTVLHLLSQRSSVQACSGSEQPPGESGRDDGTWERSGSSIDKNVRQEKRQWVTWVSRHSPIVILCACYLVGVAIIGSVNLEGDERKFVIEPYQLLGGDYTRAYLAEGEMGGAARCALKSYFFYWYYRPMFAPLIEDRHKDLFRPEEERFGYVMVESAGEQSEVTLDRYEKWLIVPEPDRWYHHGAGKPLLPAVFSIPALGAVDVVTRNGPKLLDYQFQNDYHPIFILVRLAPILAGLVSILLVYRILRDQHGEQKAILGCAVFGLFPLSLQWFPNLHHDAIMVPFVIAATSNFLKANYKRAGIYYGLALASKNAAILLLPALFLLAIERLVASRKSEDPAAIRRRMGPASRGMLWFLFFSFIALTPFANPVSYAKEILTPLTEREYDTRADDFSPYTLSARLEDPLKVYEYQSSRRPEVMLLDRLGVFDVACFFIILAIMLAGPRLRGNLAKLSFYMLLLVLPYQVIFLRGFIYRYLLFLPFFVFLIAALADTRQLRWLLVFIILVDVVLMIDPMSITSMHIVQGSRTFWETLLGQ